MIKKFRRFLNDGNSTVGAFLAIGFAIAGTLSYFSLFYHAQIRSLPDGMMVLIDSTVFISLLSEFTGEFVVSGLIANAFSYTIASAMSVVSADESNLEQDGGRIERFKIRFPRVTLALALISSFAMLPFILLHRFFPHIVPPRWAVAILLHFLIFTFAVSGFWRGLTLIAVLALVAASLAVTAIIMTYKTPGLFKQSIRSGEYKGNAKFMMVGIGLLAIWLGIFSSSLGLAKYDKSFRQRVKIDLVDDKVISGSIIFRTNDGLIATSDTEEVSRGLRKVFFIPFSRIKSVASKS